MITEDKRDYLLDRFRYGTTSLNGTNLVILLYATLSLEANVLFDLRWSEVNWYENTIRNQPCPNVLMEALAKRREMIYETEVTFYMPFAPFILVRFDYLRDWFALFELKHKSDFQPGRYYLTRSTVEEIAAEIGRAETSWKLHCSQIETQTKRAARRAEKNASKQQYKTRKVKVLVQHTPIIPDKRKATLLPYPPIENRNPTPPEKHIIPNREEWDICDACGHSYPLWKLRGRYRLLCPECRGLYTRIPSDFRGDIGSVIA